MGKSIGSAVGQYEVRSGPEEVEHTNSGIGVGNDLCKYAAVLAILLCNLLAAKNKR